MSIPESQVPIPTLYANKSNYSLIIYRAPAEFATQFPIYQTLYHC